jgi:hypothetical protein
MTTEEFIKTYNPEVQSICLQLRKIALELLPNSEEILYTGWKNFAYGTGESRSENDLIIYIAPFKDSVNLGFYRGVNLNDPKNLLKGTGKLMRHVKIKSMTDLPIEDLKHLINEAKIEQLGTN